ncbi:hypothetical protein [Tunturiibacter gelidiferens]|uniref:hypothetical protein n=1 Tax=Tunturiibacter gelidiferens TaxID=3069689 RepID=UPI003D9B1CF4
MEGAACGAEVAFEGCGILAAEGEGDRLQLKAVGYGRGGFAIFARWGFGGGLRDGVEGDIAGDQGGSARVRVNEAGVGDEEVALPRQ